MRDPERTKIAILEAAEQTLIRKGLRGLTLEDVACAAGISKGGLLHHYSGKEALILGVLQRQLDEFEKEVERHLLADPAHPGAYTRAILRANVEDLDDHCVNVWLAMMPEVRLSPSSLAVVREHCSRWQQRIDRDGLDPVVAAIIRYASEGMLFSSIWGLPRSSNHEAIVQHLLQLTRSDSSFFLQERTPI